MLVKNQKVWLIVFLALGLFLRLYQLGQKSLWSDEFSSLDRAQKSFLAIVNTPELSPPLYYFVLHLVVKRFGGSEGVLRISSALAGVVTIYLLYLIGKMWVSKEAGLASAFILSISAFHIFISQEARMYSLAILFYGLMLLMYIKAVGTAKRVCWFGYILCALAALYTSHIAVFLIAGQLLSMAFWPEAKTRHNLIALFKSLAAIGVLYIPGIVLIIHQYTWGRGVSFCPRLSLDMAIRLVGIPFHFLAGYLLANPASGEARFMAKEWLNIILVGFTLISTALVFLFSIKADKAEQGRRKFMWGMCIFPVLGLYLIMPGRVAARQLGVCILPFFISLASVICRERSRGIIKVMVVALLIINIIALADYYSKDYSPFAKADWRGASYFINANFYPLKDIIYSPWDYYLSDAGKKKNLSTVDFVTVNQKLKNGNRIWLILDPYHHSGMIKGIEKMAERGVGVKEMSFGQNLNLYIVEKV